MRLWLTEPYHYTEPGADLSLSPAASGCRTVFPGWVDGAWIRRVMGAPVFHRAIALGVLRESPRP